MVCKRVCASVLCVCLVSAAALWVWCTALVVVVLCAGPDCARRRTARADPWSLPGSPGRRYGEGHLTKIVQGVDWMLGRLRERAGGVSYNAEAVVYVASDDPTSAAQLTARPHRATIKYHQLDLPVFHVDRRARGGHAVKDMFLDVIAEHQLLAMCDGWVMPGSG